MGWTAVRLTIVRARRLWHAGADDLQRVHKEVMGLFLSSNMLFPGVYTDERRGEPAAWLRVLAVAGTGL